jgi:hypothetical protein
MFLAMVKKDVRAFLTRTNSRLLILGRVAGNFLGVDCFRRSFLLLLTAERTKGAFPLFRLCDLRKLGYCWLFVFLNGEGVVKPTPVAFSILIAETLRKAVFFHQKYIRNCEMSGVQLS